MRIRSLKPGYNTSDDIAPLSKLCRLHFAILWTYADDDGRGRDNPKLIRAALWALDDDVDEEQVEKWQGELEEKGRILRYEMDGRRYFQVCNWEKHQHPQKPKVSEYPAPPKPSRKRRVAVRDTDGTATGEVSPVVVVGEGVVEGDVKGEGSLLAPKTAPREPTQKSRLWDALEQVLGPVATNTERSLRGKVAKELFLAGATPDDVSTRSAEHQRRWPNASLTGPSLIKHWSELANSLNGGSRLSPGAHAIHEGLGLR